MKSNFKSLSIILLLSISLLSCNKSGNYTIENLPKPEIKGGKPLMIALRDRCSTREFGSKELSLQQISNLLWAANGVNRQQLKKRTAPSAMNKQEIDIYIALKQGVYFFDYEKHGLKKVSAEDIRSIIGPQKFVKDAPLSLIYVADYSKMGEKNPSQQATASADAAFISENVYLFCSSENLATVVMGYLNYDQLTTKLLLNKNQGVVFAQPVGLMK